MNKLWSVVAIIVTLNASAYTHSMNPTASGVMPQVGMCACDKINGQWIPSGTVIKTEDGRRLVVTDIVCKALDVASYQKWQELKGESFGNSKPKMKII